MRDMKKKKVLLTIQSILCVILAVMLITAALGICREGLALKASDPLGWIYTREKVTAALSRILPIFVLSLVITAVSLALGIRDEKGQKPAKEQRGRKKMSGVRAEAEKNKEKTRVNVRVLRVVLLGLACIFIVVGVAGGSARDVFGKAVNICTECIGLG